MTGTNNNYPGIGYTTFGIDHNFFTKVSVSTTTFGGDSVDGYQPSTIILFQPQTVIFTNLGTGTVEYSMNGTTVHGELNSANVNTSCLTFQNRVISKIWFRVQSGSSGPIIVSVQAWATR
jgi:hypothetical protein